MNWKKLDDISQIDSIISQSHLKTVVIFKHSTHCALSAMVKGRMEKNVPEGIDFYLLDLIHYRDISQKVADTFQVKHASPQVLLIQNGKCIFNESHYSIDLTKIVSQVLQ